MLILTNINFHQHLTLMDYRGWILNKIVSKNNANFFTSSCMEYNFARACYFLQK